MTQFSKKYIFRNKLSIILFRYDNVVHMVSAAVGAEDFYTVEDHSARFEGLEMARERDRRAIEAWEMHPYVDIVDNRGNFDSKVSKYIRYDHDLFLAPSVLECPSKPSLVPFNFNFGESAASFSPHLIIRLACDSIVVLKLWPFVRRSEEWI